LATVRKNDAMLRTRLAIAAAAVLAGLLALHFAEHSSGGGPKPPYQPHALTVTPAERVSNPATSPAAESARTAVVRHYEYVFPDKAMYVYDIDHGNRLVEKVRLRQADGIRGVVADPARHVMYISYGGDGGPNGSGSMLKYDLLHDRVLWERAYPTGVDSMAITNNGRKIFMPTGEVSPIPIWLVLDARNGRVIGTIRAGESPHNTIVGLSGRYVYMSPRDTNYLVVARTSDYRIVRRIGPLESGSRPFTINGRETIAYINVTHYLGFEIGSIRTGKILYKVPIKGAYDPKTFLPSAPSHGISLSPDEKELWVMDGPNSRLHVYDVSHVPARPPHLVATIKLTRPMTGTESPCDFDCDRAGWIQHSRSGRFVYVGDSGDVIDTKTRKVVADLDPMYESKKTIEIDWKRGVPVLTTTRYGLGYVR
jgi:hypothetical protein